MNITSEQLINFFLFKNMINSTKLEDITVNGEPIPAQLIEEWKFTGLNNVDFINLNIDFTKEV